MTEIHAKILEKDGKKEFAVLPYEELLHIQEELNDYADLKDLRAAKEKEGDTPGLSLSEALRKLEI